MSVGLPKKSDGYLSVQVRKDHSNIWNEPEIKISMQQQKPTQKQ